MIEVLYLHLPFCVSRCAYCDFATSACDDGARMDAYVEALCLQLRRAAKAGLLGQVKTIYIGGGTPTHLGSRRLNTLVYTLAFGQSRERRRIHLRGQSLSRLTSAWWPTSSRSA